MFPRIGRLESSLAAVLVGAAWLHVSSLARAEVRLPVVFGDHMVLQRGREVPIWGWAEPGETIQVTLGELATFQTEADALGHWAVGVEPLAAGGPHRLTVTGRNEVTVNDVWVGEVWICSGQSNMAWPVTKATDAAREVAAGDHPRLRMLHVARAAPDEPAEDLAGGTWKICGPDTVGKFSAVGYFFGRKLLEELDVPVGLINASWGGTMCEAWTSRTALESHPDFAEILRRADAQEQGPGRGGVLFNGMVAPLVPYAVRGVIWYQGEANVGRAAQYRLLFSKMIEDWRQRWGQGDFPFLFVQLAPFRYQRHDPTLCAELWDSQFKTLSLPNTGMAVITDVATLDDIHPANKQDVGKRLALWALAKTYGQDLVYSGPLYRSFAIEGNQIRIEFDHAANGLASRDGEPLSEFSIAGEDRQFVPAEAIIAENTVLVSSAHVPKPIAVRFGWQDTAQPNLVNSAQLPASPFRTDDFPLLTDGKH